MARWMDDGGPGVILQTRTEVVVGGVSGFLIFFLFLPIAVICISYLFAQRFISSPFGADMFVGGIMVLVTHQWIRSIKRDWKEHKELFLSL